MLVGDGGMVIPARLSGEIAQECAGMELFEAFVLEEVEAGAAQAAYARWRTRKDR